MILKKNQEMKKANQNLFKKVILIFRQHVQMFR